MTRQSAAPGTAVHEACVYGSDEEFLAMATPFVTQGLDAGEAVLVTTTAANLELLGTSLGDRVDAVDYAETAYFGRRPHQRVAGFRDYWARNSGSPGAAHVRILAEPVWAGKSQRDVTAWRRMESGLNVLLGDTNIWMICPYDERAVDPEIVAAARQTHPSLVEADRSSASGDYRDPHSFALDCDAEPLPPAPAHAVEAPVTEDLQRLRDFVAEQALRHGLADRQTALMVTAVNEAATYLLGQVPRDAGVRVWPEFGALVCELRGAGDGLPAAPFAGFRPPGLRPEPDDRLWLVRHLCSHVDIRSGPDGHTLRLHLPTGRDEEITYIRSRGTP